MNAGSESNCVHEQVAKADCECPIYITYTNVNGYLIPNLTYKSGEQMEQPGKDGFLRRDYLKNHKNSLYQVMLLQDTIGKHLLEVDKAAREREEVVLKHKTISRRFLFSAYNRRSRIFEVPIWHLKNTRVRKKGWTRWQTYATVCIYRAGNINASQCIT